MTQYTAADMADYLRQWVLDARPEEIATDELVTTNRSLHAFADDQALRFALTTSLIPPAAPGQILIEIGSAPYLMSLIFAHRLGYTVRHTNLTHDSRLNPPIVMRNDRSKVAASIEWDELNVEFDKFPYSDNYADVLSCCEVIEHLTLNPVNMLGEIHRVLKPGGLLALTTPNALRDAHFRDLSRGRNIHDRYRKDFVFGAYGRHNREFTPSELCELLEQNGFTVQKCFTADIYPDRRPLAMRLEDWWIKIPQRVRALFNRRKDARLDMKGDLIFIAAAKTGRFAEHYPTSIFYPPGE